MGHGAKKSRQIVHAGDSVTIARRLPVWNCGRGYRQGTIGTFG